VGEHDHAAVQAALILWFGQHQNDWRIDYRDFSIPHIWILDPATHKGYDCTSSGFLEATEFSVAGTGIRLVLSELFARIRR
jgi:hypothetical protein